MRHFFLFLVFLVLVGSCSRNNDAIIEETPKALRDNDYSEIKISRGREELIESLYKELISDSIELKKLDEKIKEYIEATEKINKNYYAYNDKSQDYYSSATRKLQIFNDSLINEKANIIIEKSKVNYALTINETKKHLAEIKKNQDRIKDLYQLLKIKLTIKMIEKYQLDHLPKNESSKELIKKQKEVLKQLNQMVL